VPPGFAAHSRRHAIALIAAWLVVLQAFLAGVATAHAAAMQASSGAVGAICHGAPSTGSADGTAPADANVPHLCCDYCMSAVPALAPPSPPWVADICHAARPAVFSSFILVISPGAIRAGPSQAPPGRT
jgi:hypothetical protein